MTDWPAGAFEYLESYYTIPRNNQTCITGCYPRNPEAAVNDGVTNCEYGLQRDLLVYFISHVAVTILYILIPIFLTKCVVHREINRAKEAGVGGAEGADVPYTFLQYQAKCSVEAPYEYASFGGSFTEDFLECAITFALLTCFGQVLPQMSAMALIANVVEYRLPAFRMTMITCRPQPRGAEGIGLWQDMFSGLGVIAAIVNVMIFVQFKVTGFTLQDKLIIFLVLEHVMIMLLFAVHYAIPEMPDDVRQIDDYNSAFRLNQQHVSLQIPEAERFDYSRVDFSLRQEPLPPMYGGDYSWWFPGQSQS